MAKKIVNENGQQFSPAQLSAMATALAAAGYNIDGTKAASTKAASTKAASTKAASTKAASSFEVVVYSEKTLALFGETKPIKELLKAQGAIFNRALKHNNGRAPGWLFKRENFTENDIKKLLK